MEETILFTPASKSKRRDKKRQRRKHALEDVDDGMSMPTNITSSPTTATQKRRRTTNTQTLSGMVVAISTLVIGEHADEKDNNSADKAKASTNDDSLHSYRQVADDCRANGAKVSGQVHKKVHCLLCTSAAIAQSTQRVRKALKNRVPLVDVTWLYQCLDQREKLSFDGFLLQPSSNVNNDNEVPEKVSKKHKKKKTKTSSSVDNNLSDNDVDLGPDEPLPDAGWSDPVEVGCCCVCHESGETATCEWCKDCPNNDAKESKANVNVAATIPDAGWSKPVEVGCCCVCHETGDTANCEWCPNCQ